MKARMVKTYTVGDSYIFELTIGERYKKLTCKILEDQGSHLEVFTIKCERLRLKKEDITLEEWISSAD